MFLLSRHTLLALSIAALTVSGPAVLHAAPVRIDDAKAALRQVNRTALQTTRSVRAEIEQKTVAKSARRNDGEQVSTMRRTLQARAAVDKKMQPAATARATSAVTLPRVTASALKLRSNVAYVIDAQTREVLVSKNDTEVLPIASLTKLMTALVVNDQALDMDELITITNDDVDRLKGSHSRLRIGSKLTRGELMHLALMSSENRAAHALGRTYPGGMEAFVANMNAKAALLGMTSTHYVEPTGLSSDNQSSARDLALLVGVAATRPLLRELSTDEGKTVQAKNRRLAYRNTNALVRSDAWDIDLQKTGYIREAGRCLVMKANVAERPLIMVFLDSQGKNTRLGDANRVRKWLERESRNQHAQVESAEHS